jgi:threonine efflux protein
MGIFWSLATLAGVHLLAAASPGPAFVSVIQSSVRNPWRTMLLHVLGLGLASGLWACAAVFGLQALLVRVAGLYRILQLAGGLYLAWIGLQAWRHAEEAMPAELEETAAVTPLRAVWGGFTTNVANPKVMVFFGSVFTAVLKPEMPGWVRLAAIGIVLVDNMLWYGGVGTLLSSARARRAYGRAKTAIDRTAGTVMLLFGLKLVWDARRAA